MSCACLEKLAICTPTYSFRESRESLIGNVHPVSEAERLVTASAALSRRACRCRGRGGTPIRGSEPAGRQCVYHLRKAASEAQVLAPEFFQVCLLLAHLT